MKIINANMFQGTYLLDNKSVTITESQSQLDEPKNGFISQRTDSRSLDQTLTARTLGSVVSEDGTTEIAQNHTIQGSEQQQNQVDARIWAWRTSDASAEDSAAQVTHTQTTQVLEREQRMIFESVGEVQTSDGRDISFLMQLDFHNNFSHESQTETFSGSNLWVDPLVISLTGQVPQVADGSFEFDLNSDGQLDAQTETMGNLSSGMAYIAFDKNGDGEINDGSELFGATSGQGFAELAQYDDDGNGWIDENDAIFSKLSVWQPNTEAPLSSFSEAGVGAIYLQSEDTPFELTKISGDADARITQSSVALMESGVATSVFQLEWAQRPQDTLTINGVSITRANVQLNSEQLGSAIISGLNFVGTANSASTSTADNNRAFRSFEASQSTQYQGSFMEQYNVSFSHHSNLTNSPVIFSGMRTLEIYGSHASQVSSNFSINIGDDIKTREESKVDSLRAVIDSLREMRENNDKQQKFLDRFLKT
ncbi:MAG: hypothetical protein V7785_05595 [Bermanella sp.]